MRKVILALFFISRFFAICAVLAGVGAGFLLATLGAALTCFDTCPTPDQYFARFAPGTANVMIPCVALEALALLIFAGYCLAAGQARRLLRQTLALLIGGLVGVVALGVVFQVCQATLPVTEYNLVAERPAEAWMSWWGLILMFVAGAWSGVLAFLQWGR